MEIVVTLNLLGTPLVDVREGVMTLTLGDGASIAEVIDRVDRRNPGFRQAVVDEQGRLSRQFALFINGNNVEYGGGMASLLQPNDVVNVIPAITGG